jgi:hypothetical protein
MVLHEADSYVTISLGFPDLAQDAPVTVDPVSGSLWRILVLLPGVILFLYVFFTS